MTTETLLTLETHTDSDTGISHIGEIDFGIHCDTCEKWLRNDARRAEAVKTLRFLADKMEALESPFGCLR